MYYINRFWIKVTFLLIYISVIQAKEININGYFFNIFKGKQGKEYDKKNIISYFNDNINSIIGATENNYNLTIEFSENENYNDYFEEVKREIKNSKYHFFLIDYKSLFDDFTYYSDINSVVTKRAFTSEIHKEKQPEFQPYNDLSNRTDIPPMRTINKRDYFYKYTIPINEYNKIEENSYIDNFKLIIDDCKLDKDYHALPFSSSYNFLIYNQELIKGLNLKIKENLSWSNIQSITDEYNKKNPENPKSGIILSLKNEDDFTSFLLEFLFDYSKFEYIKCSEYKKGGKISNKKSSKIKYFKYDKCSNYNYEMFYNESGMGNSFKRIKYLLQNNYIHPESINFDEAQAVEKFLKGESIFLRGYALIGNNHQEFSNIRKDIVDVMIVLTTVQAQIKRAYDYNILPSFDYSVFASNTNNNVCNKIPCFSYLKNINTLSLTNTIFNKESINNKDIRMDLKNYFMDYQVKSSVKEEDNLFLSNSVLKKFNYNILLTYVKWSNFISIISIGYFILGNLYAVLLIAAVIYQKKKGKKVMEHVSSLMCIMYIIGLTSFFDTSVLSPGFPTKFTCTFSHNWNYLLLSLALCFYFIKVWKINIIVNNYKFKILGIKLTKHSHIIINATFLTVEIGLNVMWDILSPRKIAVKNVVIEQGGAVAATAYRTPFIITFILTFLSRKATDYYDEYKGFMYSMTIILISSIVTFVYTQIFNTYNHILMAEHTLGFICGVSLLSLTILPKIIESFTGKTFKKNRGNLNDETEISYENLIHEGSFKVISFKDSGYKQKDDTNYLSEEILTSLDAAYLGISNKTINDLNNTENRIANDIPIKPYSSELELIFYIGCIYIELIFCIGYIYSGLMLIFRIGYIYCRKSQ
ncbi:hypothetical protein LY90DRAFT_621879 [Neocallimastix californiae]|uniref:G-protein coupled receptors family 3 profile domain-containing protein n=1 Tax=Neocallimastix californiae TaxID=1754190 RepID=A0A1Y2FBD4_9FUNG|nr:hypothetical protein LY90DRAFT_621879 [Neocallimastix californiae]|eukprot:ORY80646.1 hypothetical protein LY90DRAFT_621879 [Neocallimastix californiae]